MTKTKVQVGQSIFDICIRETGTIESVFEFMKLNAKSNLIVSEGEELILPAIVNKQLVDYFDKKTPVNKPRLQFSSAPLNYSIEIGNVLVDENDNELVTENNDNLIF